MKPSTPASGPGELERALALFKTYLTGRRLTQGYVHDMVSAVRAGFSDPLAYLHGETSAAEFKRGRQAWTHWAEWTNNEDLLRVLPRLVGPRALPPRVRVLPTDLELRTAAERAASLASPRGPLLWILCLSGLRIGEVVRISHLEAEGALVSPEVVIRHKSMGGVGRRTWTPGCLVRPALAALLRLPPWLESYHLLATRPRTADSALRGALATHHPHDYRHAVARLLRRLGVGLDVVSAVLGHDLRGILGTTAIYAPPAPEELEAAHARLAAHLWPDGLVAPPGSWLSDQ